MPTGWRGGHTGEPCHTTGMRPLTSSCGAEPDTAAPWRVGGWVGKGAEEAVGAVALPHRGAGGHPALLGGGGGLSGATSLRVTLELSGMGRMVPSPWERGGTCAHTVNVGGQLRGPRPPASAWLHPGSCCSLPGAAGACWHPARGAMLWVLPHSREGGPSAAPAPFSPHPNTRSGGGRPPPPRLPEPEPFPAPRSSWGGDEGVTRGRRQLCSAPPRAVGPPARVLSPPPSTAAAPRAQTTQVTRVYKAHWLKETELGEKINPTTRHV